MKNFISRYIKMSVLFMFIPGSWINASVANTYFENSLTESINKQSSLSFIYDIKTCSNSNNTFNVNFKNSIPTKSNPLNLEHLSYGVANDLTTNVKNLFSPVNQKGQYPLADRYTLQNISEISLFPADYIYKLTNIISENFLRIKIAIPEFSELILILSGFGLICLQISSNSRKIEASYLSSSASI